MAEENSPSEQCLVGTYNSLGYLSTIWNPIWPEVKLCKQAENIPLLLNTSSCSIHVREDQNFLYLTCRKSTLLHTDLVQHIWNKFISAVYRKTLQQALKNLKGRWLWLAICIISFTDHNPLMQKNSVLGHRSCLRESLCGHWRIKCAFLFPWKH